MTTEKKRHPVIDMTLCELCGSCEAVCPADPNVYEFTEEEMLVAHPEACIACEECVEVCPLGAIELIEE